MRRSLLLFGTILLSFIYALLPPMNSQALSAADRDRWVTSLVQTCDDRGQPLGEEEAQHCVSQAHEIARSLFSYDKGKCTQFRDRLLQMYADTTGADIVLIHNSGGWGRAPHNEDELWGPVESEVEAILHDRGYNPVIVSFIRTSDGFFGVMWELQELLTCFPTKAKEQAEALRFLTENRPDLKILVTGLSQGGAYTNEVLKQLEGNQHVWGIAAGVPFYYAEVDSPRSVVLTDNGVQSDALKEGNAPVLLGSLVAAYAKWLWNGLEGGPLGVGAYYDPPGHRYEWSAPGVSGPITEFVQENFPGNTAQASDQ